MNDVRLLDIFILGPSQILIGIHIIDNTFLRLFMIITGIMSIIYNGHNYLHYNYKYNKIFSMFVSNKYQGKTQIHRLYNILVMYPIFAYIYMTKSLPKYLEYILLMDIVLGILYNMINFIQYLYF